MTEFINEWWFLLVFMTASVIYAIYVSISKKQLSKQKYETLVNSKPGWLLGGTILLGLIIPQIFYDEIVNTLGKEQADIMYFLYLACVLISSYYFKRSSYFFVILSNLVILGSWPRTEKMSLYIGGFVVLTCVIFFITGI